MNKRGFIFALLLVFITLFLCAFVILLYNIQQDNADNSLVSPKVVLEVRDDLELFEIREKVLIEKSLDSAKGEFGSREFISSFRDFFIDGVLRYGFGRFFYGLACGLYGSVTSIFIDEICP